MLSKRASESRISRRLLCAGLILSIMLFYFRPVFAEVTHTAEETEPITSLEGSSSDKSDVIKNDDINTEGKNGENSEKKDDGPYSSATSTDPFVVPAATWIVPECKHGENVFVVLPIVNMFKYNIRDVVVTPVLSAKTDEFPFEIDLTGFTQKIDVLLGEEAEPDRNKRAGNCVWAFRTRDNVKTGYYKLEYKVTYTNAACAIENCTISTYVRTIGLPQNGTTDGFEEGKKTSTPRVIVTGFNTEPAEVRAGEDFLLNVTVKNTSKKTAVNNMELDLTANVEGSEKNAGYAAFLPTSGANSFYIDSIPSQGEKTLSMEFTAKADLEQKPYVMDIKMKYEDDEANPFEGDANLSIPVHQTARFDTSAAEIQPSFINVGEQANLMFSIFNTGKTRLYNVQVSVENESVESALAYVGGVDPGSTGNVDLMLTGAAPSSGDGNIDCVISYEDEAGNVTSTKKTINLMVMEQQEFVDDTADDGMEAEDDGKKTLIRNIVIAASAAVILIILLVLIIRALREKKKKKEEEELKAMLSEDGDNEDN